MGKSPPYKNSYNVEIIRILGKMLKNIKKC